MFRGASLQSLIALLGRLRIIISLIVISALAVTALAFMMFTGHEVNRSTLEQGDKEALNILRVIMLNLEDHKTGLDFFRSYAHQRYEQQLRDLVAVVISHLDYLHGLQLKGILSEEQAKKAALDSIQHARYGNNDYFFIYNRQNVAISHPDPKVRGHDMSDTTDVHGTPVAKTMWENSRKQHDGFLTLWWTRLGEKKPVPKLLYYYHYPKWDWIIGTGIYIDDIERDVEKKKSEIIDVLKQTFSQVRIAETGYFTLFEGKGKILIHPSLANRDSSSMRNPSNGSLHYQDLMTASLNPAVPLKYLWDRPDNPGNYSYLKYSHVEHFKPFDWYVSSSVYQDEMERPARKILLRQALLVVVILICSISVVYLLVARVTSPLARLARHAELLQKNDFSLSEEEKQNLQTICFPDEVGHLAHTFGKMEERLDEYIKELKETTAAREKMESELRIARSIQMSMLPNQESFLSENNGIELAAFLEPAREVGGDLYDFFMVAPGRFCFVIGDVSDKGVPAALFMARSKAILRIAASRPGAMPDAILAEANRELVENNELMMFITVFLGILDLDAGELAFSNAGHLPPLLLGNDGARWVEPPPGKPLGITPRARFGLKHLHLEPGDCLLVVTDGVTEAQDQSQNFYGDERLLATLSKPGHFKTPENVASQILGDLQHFVDGAPQFDDIAILCIRYPDDKTTSRQYQS